MATYTMPLKAYIESWSQTISPAPSVSSIIETGRTHLFDFDYPFFDETKKKQFETDFIRNFYTREIGFETEGLFKFKLETWLSINMPYWNQMFQSELIEFDPLTNSKRDTTNNQTIDSTSEITGDEEHNDHATTGNDMTGTVTDKDTGTVTDNNFNRKLHSDTPDSRLEITTNDGQGVIEYASDIDENNANNQRTLNTQNQRTLNTHVGGNNDSNGGINQHQNATNNQTNDTTIHSEGKIGVQSYSKMLAEYRDTFLRIEKQIFAEMNELFMLIY